PVDEALYVALDAELLAQAHAVDQGEDRLFQERPPLAQNRAVGFDEHRLNRNRGALRDQREAPFEAVDRFTACACSFREYLPWHALLKPLHGVARHAERRAVADITHQASRA